MLYDIILAIYFFFHWIKSFFEKREICYYKRRFEALNKTQIRYAKNRKKDPWVIDKVLYIKAISNVGCGKVAEIFNQLYGHKETVSKTFVYEKLKAHQYDVFLLRKKIKNKQPRALPINQNWAIDLTKVKLTKQQKLVLGIIDQGSRLSLRLSELSSKHSARIMLEVVEAIRQFGFPKYIKTDNKACFKSKWMKLCLKLLGIKHQTTDIAAPWKNGRMERFFGTFKEKIKQVVFSDHVDFQSELTKYQFWYNKIRPHQNLNGLTPYEAFSGKLCRHKAAIEINRLFIS